MGRTGSVLRRAAVSAAVVTAIAGGGVVAAAEPALASVTVSGDVVCEDGSAVVGVWIQAAGGSGWASGTSVFSKSGVTTPWTVHVGCGGTPSNWKYSVIGYKNINSTFANWGCWPYPIYPYATGCWTPAN